MSPSLPDLMKAVDDIEQIRRKVFDTFEPLWDRDELMMTRAMAILHAHVRELNQP